jgi:predicted house-cleaning noncanonical NTP pyrophosphatase (MazG superfamily)
MKIIQQEVNMTGKRRFKMATLVRDKMPKRLGKLGVFVEAYPLKSKDHLDHLKLKLQEEVEEVLTSTTAKDIKEEIADVMEVLYSIAKYYGLQIEHIEKKRLQKVFLWTILRSKIAKTLTPLSNIV